MPSALKKSLLTLGALIILVICLLLALAGSEGGTRLLGNQVRALSGGALDWERLDGALLDSLNITGLQYSQPDLVVEVRS